MNNIELRTQALGRKFIRFDFTRPKDVMRSASGLGQNSKDKPGSVVQRLAQPPGQKAVAPPDQTQVAPEKLDQPIATVGDTISVSPKQFHFFCGSVFVIASALLIHAFPEEFRGLYIVITGPDPAQTAMEVGGIWPRALGILKALSIPVLTFTFTALLSTGYYFRWIMPKRPMEQKE